MSALGIDTEFHSYPGLSHGFGLGTGTVVEVYDGNIWTDFWARSGVIDFEPLPLGVIVTAAGSGNWLEDLGL